MAEHINHPKHYTKGSIECIDYINDKQLNFNLGNVVKYITRAGLKKGNSRMQDLQKAAKYLEFEIEYEMQRLAEKEAQKNGDN